MAFYLGNLSEVFGNGLLEEYTVENGDETNFVFKMSNGETLGIRGEQEVGYADLVSGEDPIKMMVRLTGGKKQPFNRQCLCFRTQVAHIHSVVFQIMLLLSATGPHPKDGWMV